MHSPEVHAKGEAPRQLQGRQHGVQLAAKHLVHLQPLGINVRHHARILPCLQLRLNGRRAGSALASLHVESVTIVT